jgi:hypothetical protein
MKWMRERDLLIAQTMAFVQSVTGKKPDADQMAVRPAAAQPFEAPKSILAAAPIPDIEALLAGTSVAAGPSRPAAIARFEPRSDFKSEQSEIKARVANFRAHQERFNRERDAYCSATMAKVHAALGELGTPPRPAK